MGAAVYLQWQVMMLHRTYKDFLLYRCGSRSGIKFLAALFDEVSQGPTTSFWMESDPKTSTLGDMSSWVGHLGWTY